MDVVRSGLGKQGFIYPGRAGPWNTLHCFHVERMDGVEKEVEIKVELRKTISHGYTLSKMISSNLREDIFQNMKKRQKEEQGRK